MNLTCPKCRTAFSITPEAGDANPLSVTCHHCGAVYTLDLSDWKGQGADDGDGPADDAAVPADIPAAPIVPGDATP